jgi:hypothetical protein
MDLVTYTQERKALAERYGVTVYTIGAFRAHAEVLRRFNIKGNRDRHYHCRSNHPLYEEGILSCRKTYGSQTVRAQYKLITGKRKEAIDCEKMALWCTHAIGIKNWTIQDWEAQEKIVYNMQPIGANNG